MAEKGDAEQFDHVKGHLVSFLQEMGQALTKYKHIKLVPPAVAEYFSFLDAVAGVAQETPPLAIRKRYGNPAFRTFMSLIKKELPCNLPEDCRAYILESFGNETRIDYGTGHELAFIAALLIWKNNLILSKELVDTEGQQELDWWCCQVFMKYHRLVRYVLERYALEPAGSHGVWGLDDYVHVPFYLGAMQASVQYDFDPSDILVLVQKQTVRQQQQQLKSPGNETIADKLIWQEILEWVQECKGVTSGAPFEEHSPLIAEISRLPSGWLALSKGLLKMWQAEVLGKQPVIQHFVVRPGLSIHPETVQQEQSQPEERMALAKPQE